MNSIEFGKKCRPYNKKYKELFGYIPCEENYACSQDVFFTALLTAIETKQDISTLVPKKEIDYLSPENIGKRY